MKEKRTSEYVNFKMPIEETRGGKYLVCVAFSFRENAEAAVKIIGERGIEASICELQPYEVAE